MAEAYALLIRFLHVFSGVMWVGGTFLWGMIIAPNVLQRGPPMIRRPFMEAVLERMTRYMMIAGALTVITGFWTMGILVGWSDLIAVFQGTAGPSPAYGIALGVGAVAAIVMYLEGLFVIKPSGARMLELMRAMPAPEPGAAPPAPPAELAELGKKLGIASMTSLVLGTVALGAMVWAVNVVRV